MIASIGAWFDEQIVKGTDLLERSYNMFVHRIAIKNNTIQEIMVDDVVDICLQINEQNKSKEFYNPLVPNKEAIKRLISNKFSSSFNPALFDRIFKDYVKLYSGELNPQRGTFHNKKFQKGKNYSLAGSSRQLTIVLGQGLVDMKNARKTPSPRAQTGGQYNVVLATTRRVYGNLLGKIRAEIIEKAKGAMGGDADVSGTSDITSEYLLIRGHGKTIAGGREPDLRAGTPATRAILSAVDALSTKVKEVQEQVEEGTGGSIGSQMLDRALEHVIEAYRNVLEEQYTLRKFVSGKELEFKEDLIIEMEIISRGKTGSGIMAQDAMDIWDAAKLRRDLREAVTEVLKKKLPAAVRKWPLVAGSPTKVELFERQYQRIVIEQLFKHLKSTKKTGKGGVDLRFKVNKQLLTSLKKKVKKGESPKYKRITTKQLRKGIIGAAAKGYKSRKKVKAGRGVGKVAESPIALKNILNEALPQVVASKMSAPALQFRTGRFANSARVDMVHTGKRGGMKIDYTYMKNPYQTFEPGFAKGSTMRDPRKIIGESIRELAMGILGRQPHTIRRT